MAGLYCIGGRVVHSRIYAEAGMMPDHPSLLLVLYHSLLIGPSGSPHQLQKDHGGPPYRGKPYGQLTPGSGSSTQWMQSLNTRPPFLPFSPPVSHASRGSTRRVSQRLGQETGGEGVTYSAAYPSSNPSPRISGPGSHRCALLRGSRGFSRCRCRRCSRARLLDGG